MRARAIPIAATLIVTASLPLSAPMAAQDASASPDPGSVTLTLIHDNDGESSLLPLRYAIGETGTTLEIGGISAFTSVLTREIAQARSMGNSVVTVSAGDSMLASATLACSAPPQPATTPIHDAIAQGFIPYDVHVFGNHEFDLGPAFLRRFVKTFTGGGKQPIQPFLSANLDFRQEPAWRRLLVKNGLIDGAPRGGRVVGRSAIVRDAATKEAFGVVAATTPLLPVVTSPGKVTVTPDLPTTAKKVQKEIDRLTKKGIDRIILVSHLQDIDNDKALVALLHGVDVAVSGGGAELLASDTVPDDIELLPGEQQTIAGSYPLESPDADGRDVPIVTTAGEHRYVGRLDITFDASGAVTGVIADTSYPRRVIPETQSGSQILDLGITDAVPGTFDQDTNVVAPVLACLKAFQETPVARSEVVLNVARGGTDPFSLGVRSAETNGGDLVADSFLAAYDRYAGASGLPPRGPDNLVIAVENGGGIRQSAGDLLPAGGIPGAAISRLDTIDVLPFDNHLVTADSATAAQLDAILERSCAANGGGGFLQVAGLAYTCDLTRPAGDQAVSVTYTAGTADPADDVPVVDADGTVADVGPFRLITHQFTAGGGDDHATFATLPETKVVDATGVNVLYEQAFREYLLTFTATGEPPVPTIATDDLRYATLEGDGRITIIRP